LCLATYSRPFSRRGGCADGVVSKFQQNKVRFANIDKEATRRPFTNHPALGFERFDASGTPP
jgi:hypothetical protein